MEKGNKNIPDFGKIHLKILLSNTCHFHCAYENPDISTMPANSDFLWMNTKEICKIASEFVALGIKKIHIIGFEQLVRKEAKFIIQTISKLSVELIITSNGILINEIFNTFLQTGIKSVNVDLQTLKADKFFTVTKHNNFEKVLFNIHLLLANNFSVKVNVLLMNGINEDEILDFVQWTKNLPLSIRFFEFIPSTENSWDKEKTISNRNVLKFIESKFQCEEVDKENKSASKIYKVAGFAGRFELMSNIPEKSSVNFGACLLTADGKLINQMYLGKEIDLLTPLRKRKKIRSLIIDSLQAQN